MASPSTLEVSTTQSGTQRGPPPTVGPQNVTATRLVGINIPRPYKFLHIFKLQQKLIKQTNKKNTRSNKKLINCQNYYDYQDGDQCGDL